MFSPKSLLRHPDCISFLWEFDDIPDDAGVRGVRFKRVIVDEIGILPKLRGPTPPLEPEFKRVVFCSGKVYYELRNKRDQLKIDNIAIVRIEQVKTRRFVKGSILFQLAPFPFDLVCRELKRYPNAEMVWCQEEPKNMGAYRHIEPRMITCMKHEGRDFPPLRYIGRESASSPATGYKAVHSAQQEKFLNEAMNLTS